MSDTPRTDDQAVRIMFGNLDTIVPVEFARQLETELGDKNKQLAKAQAEIDKLNAEVERLKGVVISQITPEPIVLSSYSTTAELAKDERDKLIEQMRVALAWLYQWIKNEIEHFDANTPDDEIIKEVEAALSAAEGGE